MIATRLRPGAISESSSSHLPASEASKLAKPVMFPPGWLSRATMPLATGSPAPAKTIGIVRVSRRGRFCHDDVGLQADQLLRKRSYPIGVTAVPPKVHPQVAAIGPTQARKRLRERRDESLRQGIVFVEPHEHADAPYAGRPAARAPRAATPPPRPRAQP
jgi:hypothetical protein